jgi:3-phenylpropionate/cinnamic acid dioxygenase small subunit
MPPELLPHYAALLYREAACLDDRRWSEWLSLYTDDAEFWVPTWDIEGQPTDDPQAALSLIYYNDRRGLEDRIWRIESGVSPATSPTVRTCHLITNVRVVESGAAAIRVASNWQVQIYRPEQQASSAYFGFYEHLLRPVEESLKIARKKIVLLNDVIDGALDISHI